MLLSCTQKVNMMGDGILKKPAKPCLAFSNTWLLIPLRYYFGRTVKYLVHEYTLLN